MYQHYFIHVRTQNEKGISDVSVDYAKPFVSSQGRPRRYWTYDSNGIGVGIVTEESNSG